jgi:hypothetical protein
MPLVSLNNRLGNSKAQNMLLCSNKHQALLMEKDKSWANCFSRAKVKGWRTRFEKMI